MKNNKMKVITKRLNLLFVAIIASVAISCEEEFSTIGANVIDEANFNVKKANYNVYAANKKIKAVRTNGLPLYQLGRFTDPIYGTTEAQIASQMSLPSANPVFGNFSQEVENNADADSDDATIQENETVTEVYLHIPFFIDEDNDADNDGVDDTVDADPTDPNSDTDGDGVSDSVESSVGTNPLDPDTDGDGIDDGEDTDTEANIFPRTFKIDSIYGNKLADFNVKVNELTYFLRDLDPDANFQQAQEYYSNQDFTGFLGATLFDGPTTISGTEVIINNVDDPETPDVDESTSVKERISPGLRVALDPQFFQEKIIDKEGSVELSSNNNFKEYLRGIFISTHSFSDDVLMLLDYQNASVTITYEYDKILDNELTKETKTFEMSLSQSINNVVNTFTHTAYPDISGAEKLYLKGGAGSFIELKLFDEDDETTTVLDEIKNNNWLINEASITFFVDRQTLDAAGVNIEPQRVYLYKLNETGEVIADYDVDFQQTRVLPEPFMNYGGKLEVNENDEGVYYKIRITEHISNILKDNEENVRLGLVITSNINNVNTFNALLETDQEVRLPIAATINPLGTVLFGNEASGDDASKKLQLEIVYTETN